MRSVETASRADASGHDNGGRKRRPGSRRIVQFLGIAALPATMALAQAASDPFNIEETEAGIPVTDALVQEKCGGCHTGDENGNLSRISWVRTTPEGWAQAIRRMVKLNGLSITPEETRSVIRSLSASHGLAPEESRPVMYLPEHRMLVAETNIPNETVRQACASCHAFAQPLSWRRSKAEWRLLRNLHVSLYSQADAQYRRPVEDSDQPGAAGDSAKPLPVEVALEYMTAKAPLHTPEWAAWQGRMQSSKLGGKWLVKAALPGKGLWAGEMVVTPAPGTEEYATTVTLKSLTDGTILTRTGKGVVYTGYSWRGTSTGRGGSSAPDAPQDHELRETMWFSPDRTSAEGRWFWGEYKEFGFDVQLTRATAEPVIIAVMPQALKTGAKAQKVTIYGNALPAGLAAGDVDLGKGVTVRSIVSASPTQAVITVDVAADAPVGQHDLGLPGAISRKAMPIYDRVAYLKVTPEAALSRLGGGAHAPGYQQFEAIGYAAGLDGKPETADDVPLGPIDVTWSMAEMPTVYYDDDVKYVGKLSPAALFTPNIDGPNPDRKWGRNNYGEVWVVATARSEQDKFGKPLTARAFLVVTVPAYKRWDPTEVAK